jgi:hypothetical protein
MKPDRAYLMPFLSRAFTREDDFVDHLSVRPISSDPNQVTQRGLQMIEQALAKAGRDVRYWSVRRASAVVMPAAAGVDLERGGASMFSSRADAR